MKTYLNNVKKSIEGNLRWIIEDGNDKNEFLDSIIEFCGKLKDRKYKKKTQKTRHG